MRGTFVSVALVFSVVISAAEVDSFGVWRYGVEELNEGDFETTEHLKAAETVQPMRNCPKRDILSVTACACYILQEKGDLSVAMWKLCHTVHKEQPKKLKKKCKAEFYKKDENSDSTTAGNLNEDSVFDMVFNMTMVCKPTGKIDTRMILPTPYPSAFPKRGSMPKPIPPIRPAPTSSTEAPKPTQDSRPPENIMFDEFFKFETNLGVLKLSRQFAKSAFGKNYYCCKLHYYVTRNTATCVIKSRCGGVRCKR